jgi:hypothetical protein
MNGGLNLVRKRLIQRLEAQGIDKCLIPGLVKLMASAFFNQPYINRQIVHRRMEFLGWKGFELDEHTYQMAKACFESEEAGADRRLPDTWFTTHFSVVECS